MILTRDVAFDVLEELAARTSARGVTATVHVVGGAAIAVGYNPDREATTDIDAWVNGDAEARKVVFEIAERIGEERLFVMKLRAGRGRRDFPDAAFMAEIASVGSVTEAVELYDLYYPHDELKSKARAWLEVFFSETTDMDG